MIAVTTDVSRACATIQSAMARLPRDPSEAVEALGIAPAATVIAVGPDHGFSEALTQAVGKDGNVIVQSPPPDEDAPSGVDVVESIPDDAKADHVMGWIGVVPVHAARKLGGHVSDNGSLWLVLPKVERDARASVTEGEVKRAMLAGGWKEERVVVISTGAFAVRFRRRR
jgi:hypothetical protein